MVISTISKSDVLMDEKIDVVIVDEAAQVCDAELATVSRNITILLGDHL